LKFSNVCVLITLLGTICFSFAYISSVGAAPRVIVRNNSTGWVDNQGRYVISGEVENDGDTAARNAMITATLYDSSSNVIATASNNTMMDILLPGRKSGFAVTLLDTAKSALVDHYTLNLTYSNYSQSKALKLEIILNSSYTDENQMTHVFGTVKNDGSETATSVHVLVTCYNDTGYVVDVNSGQTIPDSINSGQTAPFDVEFVHAARAAITTNWAIAVESQEYEIIPEYSFSVLIFVLLAAIAALLILALRGARKAPRPAMRMREMTASEVIRIVALLMLLAGFVFLLASAIYDSYVSAFSGLGLVFWGALLLLIVPTKYVKLELLTASSSLQANSEEMMNLTGVHCKGVYLPPKLLRDYQSSLVFIPAKEGEVLPTREEIDRAKTLKSSRGLVLTPPGLALSRLFEAKMGKSFTELSLDQLQRELPKLFEELEITKTANINVEDNIVTVDAKNHVFKELCKENMKLERTHEAVGCIFSSAIACALAKATGKPATIEKDEHNQDGEMTLSYRILEE
jgi:hypothetical protein